MGLSVAWEYTGVARPLLTRIKSGQGRHVIRNLTRRALDIWNLPGEFDVVTWIPTAGNRRRERGYDQGRVMAGEVSRWLGPSRKRMLETVRGKGSQKGYHLKERYLKAPGSFRVRGNPSGMKILLVDDVVTTGASLNEGARLLLEAGAGSVFCLALNRSPIKKLDK
jgi:ComF family protein